MGKRVAIVGVADRIGKIQDNNVFGLFSDLLIEATKDAGLRRDDIDGIIATQSLVFKHSRLSTVLAEYAGIRNYKWADSVNLGAQSHGTMISRAASAIKEGLADTIVIASVDFQLTGLTRDLAVKGMADIRHPEFERPYGLFMPAIMALKARKYLHFYNASPDIYPHVAVTMRKHASLKKDNVMYRDPITVEDVLKSKKIAEPLHLLDCAPIVDGGAVLIMTSEEKARNLKKKPVLYLGGGENYSHDNFIQDPDLLSTPIKCSVDRAFNRVDIKKSDVDILFIHDAFTPVVIFALEDFGLCERGAAGNFVKDGNIEINGAIPVNTNGGLLSQGHPGIPGGLLHVVEAIRQLRGECGPGQVHEAKVAASIHFGGPLSMASTSLWGVSI